ncbi:MAG: lipid-A-disaccharide synthase [Nevskiaceae bacterium]|nr:MAG: lipid-A-disaccharide synthase [Nevskiaceae bacterium]TBR71778.1 MAG: lipid-A-disaccharide synthase [Nevskiaceae bacterium]
MATRIALVAGETSGDLLGAALMGALRRRYPDVRFEGVAGPRMIAAGCRPLAGIERLSVMGIAEVLPKLFSILRLRARLVRHWLADPPDVVIGIDAPDFNLGLERRLRDAGIRTAHLVSPSVWAWRPRRVKTIAKSVDLMLCLFPFEPDFYRNHGVKAVYVGHPLAEELALPVSRADARTALGLPAAARVVAVLPGSRVGELKALAAVFVLAAARLASRVPDVVFAVPLARPALRLLFERAMKLLAPDARWMLYDGRSREVMRAADVVLLASGTATLECLLLERPMVVGYRASRFTAWVLRVFKLLKVAYFSLPNLLCEKPVVPEFIQEQATPEHFAGAVEKLIDDSAARTAQTAAFAPVRQELHRDAATRAGAAIAELVGEQRG